MSEGGSNDPMTGLPSGLPTPAPREGSSFSLVWVIPIVAVVIGGWIAFRAISEQGPTITIAFKSAEGIEAGQTKVAYKDLQVGRITNVDLAEDLSHVIATAELVPGAYRYLKEGTRFWVVRPQISAGRITGLGTLLSGAYIAMDPVTEGEDQESFIGLETPPVVTTAEEGTVYTLMSKELGSIDVGAPVYYREIAVGEVASYEMDAETDKLKIQVFIRAPHDARVRSNTRFWNVSGFDVTVNAQGLRIETASVVSMLIGGIAFENHDPDRLGEAVEEFHVFPLDPSRRASAQPRYDEKSRFRLYFDEDSVEGLSRDSPVVFRGVQVGRVLEVSLELDPGRYEVRVPVEIEIEPGRLALRDQDPPDRSGWVEQLVEYGMRAQLQRGNLLTGGLQVALDLHPDAPRASVVIGPDYKELPTLPAGLDALTASLGGVVAKIDAMPLESIGRDLQGSLAELRTVLVEFKGIAEGMNGETLPALNSTLTSVDSTVTNLDQLLADDAPLALELRKAMRDVGEAARSVRVLADYLEQHPESLIQGK